MLREVSCPQSYINPVQRKYIGCFSQFKYRLHYFSHFGYIQNHVPYINDFYYYIGFVFGPSSLNIIRKQFMIFEDFNSVAYIGFVFGPSSLNIIRKQFMIFEDFNSVAYLESHRSILSNLTIHFFTLNSLDQCLEVSHSLLKRTVMNCTASGLDPTSGVACEIIDQDITGRLHVQRLVPRQASDDLHIVPE